MSQLTAGAFPDLASPLPQRESWRARVLRGLLSWVNARGRFGSPPSGGGVGPERSEQHDLGMRPLMAAAWYGSLGPGPMCLPGQPAIGFNPGYRD